MTGLACAVSLVFSASALAQVDNTQSGYVGLASGNWSAGGVGVQGIPDGSCSNMGAQGKANFISDFGFNIPVGATITGVTAFPRLGSANPETVIFQLADDVTVPSFLGSTLNANLPGGSGGSCGTTGPGQYPATVNNNLGDWGNPVLTPAVVNSPNFGLGLTTNSNGTVKFDSVCLQIAYTTASGPAVTEQCLTAPPVGSNLQVVKTVVGAPPGTDWDFQWIDPGINSTLFALPAAGGFESFLDVTPGTHEVVEITKPGYSVTSECTVDEIPITDTNESDAAVQIAIQDGQNVVCTFVNTLDTATYTVAKDFDDDNGATVGVSLSCDSGTVSPAGVQDLTELVPVVFTVTGAAGTPNCTATESNIPAGYTSDASDCLNDPLSSGGCTITNTLNTANFTVSKDFVNEDNATPVSVSLSCASGTVTTSPLNATEAAPAVFEVTGYVGDPNCTATETPVPGYTADQTGCANVALLASGSCTITNTLNTAQFTVSKDFSPDNPGTVSVSLSCESGAVTTSPLDASEAAPAVFDVTGFDGDPNCTATETPVPPGYSADQTGCANVALLASGSCTITNTLNTAQFSVSKDFVDEDNATPVSISLSCDSGTVTTSPLNATEAAPAVFEVTGAVGDPNCTATETPVPGYTPEETGCAAVALSTGTCTITNTLNTAQFSVSKDFVDEDNATPVSVSLSCESGTVTTSPLDATEAAPAVFEVTGYDGDPNCTATETPVPGYTPDETGCAAVALSTGTCTITNTLSTGSFTVNKDFVNEDNATPVSVSLSCESGTVTTSPLDATEAAPAVFEVTGYDGDPNCTATETPVPGYTPDETGCAAVALSTGTCTITNTLNVATFDVLKDFEDDAATAVSVEFACDSGTVTTSPLDASEGSPASFEVTGYDGDPNCTATEPSVPDGYTSDATACTAVALSTGSCTITNTVNTGTFTVRKIFEDDNPMSVDVTAVCTPPAVVDNNPQQASISASAIFNVSYVVDGVTTCTATEVVPPGYEVDDSSCQTPTPINGGCALVNTPISASIRVTKTFTDGNPADVDVRLTCNAGDDLVQEFTLGDGEFVTFSVSGFDPSADCWVQEISDEITGYSAEYAASSIDGVADAVRSEEDGCYYDALQSGGFVCDLTNVLQPVPVEVTKEWIGDLDQIDANVDFSAYAEYTCYEVLDGPSGPVGTVGGQLYFHGVEDEDTFYVYPYWDGDSYCTVTEDSIFSIVEADDSDCGKIEIEPGTEPECTIYNTVFFEGIPTLGQYGKALLVLLMLGVGLVGFRRFV